MGLVAPECPRVSSHNVLLQIPTTHHILLHTWWLRYCGDFIDAAVPVESIDDVSDKLSWLGLRDACSPGSLEALAMLEGRERVMRWVASSGIFALRAQFDGLVDTAIF